MRPAPLPAVLSLIAAGLAASGLLPADVVARETAPLAIEAWALDSQPQSRVEAAQAMDGAVAASVIGAIATQFGERKVAVKLDDVAVRPTSVRDRSVSGTGRLQIGGDPNWIPFRFAVLYDTRTASTSYPALTLGDTGAMHEIALDSTLARDLGRRADAAIGGEFSQQPVQLRVNRVTTADAGERYLRVEATGTADFAAEGSTPAQVQALYDRRTGEWLRIEYELGTTSNWGDAAVAVR